MSKRTRNEARIERERTENRKRHEREWKREIMRLGRRHLREIHRVERPAAFDREKYGAAVDIEKLVWARSNGGWSGNKPRPQRYPSGCRRLFRVNGIKPHQAEAGKIPEACR